MTVLVVHNVLLHMQVLNQTDINTDLKQRTVKGTRTGVYNNYYDINNT